MGAARRQWNGAEQPSVHGISCDGTGFAAVFGGKTLLARSLFTKVLQFYRWKPLIRSEAGRAGSDGDRLC
jgi:hypothetical protein